MKVVPFKAYRYNADVVGDVAACIAPPYDVINETLQDRLYEQSPYNIVRVIKGKSEPINGSDNNVYTRAAGYLSDWIQEGALREEGEEAMYGYVQDFEVAGTPLQRLSFISLVELEPFGGAIKPHEKVLQKPMMDRLELKRAAEARFGLVFMLYDDPENVAEQAIRKACQLDPEVDFVDEQDVRHRLYPIKDKTDHDAISAMMAEKTCVIADGHHRYTTGLLLREECDRPSAKYQMVSLANTRQEGVIVLATHRLVHGLADFSLAPFLARLGEDFDLDRLPFNTEAEKEIAKANMLDALQSGMERGDCVFGYYAADGAFYVATLKDRVRMDEVAADMSEAWRELDVAVLHKLILEVQLGIDDEKLSSGKYITYVKDTPTAIDDSITQVDQGQQQAAFLTNPIRIEQLFAVTETGERMPQKSTYFYPKMYTGLTIQKL